MTTSPAPIHVVGGGLAGSEAAWQIARAGVPVILHEMRPAGVRTDAHQTDGLAELVCSNSFRSDDWQYNAVGLLHAEMRRWTRSSWPAATPTRSPPAARWRWTAKASPQAVTARLQAHPLITVVREEIAGLPPADWDSVIVATGPLTSPALADAVLDLTGEESAQLLRRHRADRPRRVHRHDIAWRQSRYDKEGPGGDAAAYINCPMDKDQYDAFIDALLSRSEDRVQGVGERPLFRRLPADRGDGRTRPRDPAPRPDEAGRPDQSHNPKVKAARHRPAASGQRARYPVQHGRLPDQAEARRPDRGLPHDPGPGERPVRPAGRLAPQHLSQQPKLLDRQLRLKAEPRLRFAGQVTGVEGYVESAATGLLAGRLAAAERLGKPLEAPPAHTAIGALVEHITGGHLEGARFSPMNVNYGLLPPLEAPRVDADGNRIPPKDRGRARKRLMSVRAMESLTAWRDVA
jgi:methylenetetrahydrofolate--tRNA-(uracil-5-)-methyltransferase